MKDDAIIQCWMPRVEIALAAQWLEKHGYRLHYMSDIARIAIQGLAIKALENGIPVPTLEEAEEILRFLVGKRSLNPSGRRAKNLMANLIEEEGVGQGGLGVGPKVGPHLTNEDEQQIKEQLEVLKQFERKEKRDE